MAGTRERVAGVFPSIVVGDGFKPVPVPWTGLRSGTCVLVFLETGRVLGWEVYGAAVPGDFGVAPPHPPSQAGCASLDASLNFSEPGLTHIQNANKWPNKGFFA